MTQMQAPQTGKDGNSQGINGAVPGKGRAKPLAIGLLLVVLVVGGTLGLRYWSYASIHVTTDNAYLTSDVIQISPQVSGTVKEVPVKDNQMVKKGDLLAVLDDATYRAAYNQAQANLEAALAQAKGAGAAVALTQETGSAQVEQAQGMVEQAQSGIVGARADVARSQAAIANARAMAKGAEANTRTAQAGLQTALANRQKAQAGVKAAQAAVETARAQVGAAQAALETAQANYDKATRDARRFASLRAEGAISEQAADQAVTAERAARSQLDSTRQQVTAAESVVAARQADLNAQREQIRAADAGIAQARAQQAAAREQADAAWAGVGQMQAQYHAVQQGVRQAAAKRQQALGQLSQARTAPRQVAVSRSSQSQAQAKIDQAKAALEAARIQLNYTRIFAPADGQVSKKTVEVGALVQPGTPLMAIVPRNDLWVVANFKETQLTNVKPGQAAEIDVDGLPGRKFTGKVESIAAATGATFALLPPDNATGNFTKVVQRIPVKIALEAGQSDIERLRAGMSVTVAIRTQD